MIRHPNSHSSTDVSYIRHCTAAADNPYYQTTAAPNSFASLIRGSIVIRDAAIPISFPFEVEEVVGYYRRAG
ncbi:MAG TPA: hypothetical protein VJM09_11980 [Sphingobium sp.]|nr:hypothetical protein [Sphingobium sp.]